MKLLKNVLSVLGFFLAVLLLASSAGAQLAAPNDMGITMGHIHLNVPDPAASKAFWVSMGGVPSKLGMYEAVKFPNVTFIFTKAEPTGPSADTIVNHVGFLVKDGLASVAKFKALGTKMELNANGHGGFFYTPDGLRLEMPERATQDLPIVFDQIHFFVQDPGGTGSLADMRAWYEKVFGAKAGQPGGTPATAYEAEIIPGVNLRYSKITMPAKGTKGSAIDHIGFEVKNLEAFCKKLQAQGIKLDRPYAKRPDLGISIAFITDPWGTYIELTEGLDKL